MNVPLKNPNSSDGIGGLSDYLRVLGFFESACDIAAGLDAFQFELNTY
jgi:hypothetical protein